jgi:hypothetical protein
LEEQVEWLLALVAEQPDLTLDEIVAAMRKISDAHAADHPGEDLPAFRYAFEVTSGPAVSSYSAATLRCRDELRHPFESSSSVLEVNPRLRRPKGLRRKQSRLNKSEQHCEKEGERKRAHNKMHDQPPSAQPKTSPLIWAFLAGMGVAVRKFRVPVRGRNSKPSSSTQPKLSATESQQRRYMRPQECLFEGRRGSLPGAQPRARLPAKVAGQSGCADLPLGIGFLTPRPPDRDRTAWLG